ncbi:exonuclease SbcCD subunit D [bacterium]|nr:exonuclease SbcCD subunit D [bacterium]
MRFLHTADWHLGRLFHGFHLTEDQAHVLDQLIDVAADARPDAILVAGDIYDRAIPPAEAVSLLDDVLERIAIGLKIPLVMIAGNHDSPERLGFGARILRSAGVHVTGTLPATIDPVLFADDDGPVHVYPVPYTEPAGVRDVLGRDDLSDHQTAMSAIVDGIAARYPKGERSILVGHAFVAGGMESESERPLSIGGAGTVDAGTFAPFDYTALGHLHAPQQMAGGRVRYSGSLLKYSFSEIPHRKGISLIEMNARGECAIEDIPLTPRHDLRRVEGTLDEILRGPQTGESADDYLVVRLTDKKLHLNAMGRLREVYPNVLHIEKPWLEETAETVRFRAKPGGLSDVELLKSFYEETTGAPPSDAQVRLFVETVERIRLQEREAD